MKTKLTSCLTLGLLCVGAAFHTNAYTAGSLVPFREYNDARREVFNFFDQLEREGAYLVSDDGHFLGKIARSGSDALNNTWGFYGSSWGYYSIFNPTSLYGSDFSDLSPFNSLASAPPTLRFRKGGEEQVAGYITRNPYYYGRYSAVPLIDPNCLCDWLKAPDCCK